MEKYVQSLRLALLVAVVVIQHANFVHAQGGSLTPPGINTTNYEIAASNRYGPIVDITATGSAAVSGSSAASVLTNTEPNANYSH